jgi:hypothetical protein
VSPGGGLRRRTALGAALAAGAGAALTACTAQPSPAAGPTLRVHAGRPLRPVTHVAAGGLYALATATSPTPRSVAPLHLRQLTQPPPGVQQLGNGATVPTGDALVVAGAAVAVGAHEYIRMPDIYPDFPYTWRGWPDWSEKVERMVRRVRAADVPAVNGWELWNEPDWTWDTAKAGAFEDGWTRTHRMVRAQDPHTPIVGPSFSLWSDSLMAGFLAAAKQAGTLPDVISWHELQPGTAGWSAIGDHIASYRALAKSLGVAERPISINEYAAKDAIDVPGSLVHFLAAFEAGGVDNAERAYWYESGTVGGLLTSADEPTGTYWLYDWYGAMRGEMVHVDRAGDLDGFAALDAAERRLSVVVGGAAAGSVRVDGLSGFGSEVRVRIDRTRTPDRHTAVASATRLSDARLPVHAGGLTVALPPHTARDALRLLVTA